MMPAGKMTMELRTLDMAEAKDLVKRLVKERDDLEALVGQLRGELKTRSVRFWACPCGADPCDLALGQTTEYHCSELETCLEAKAAYDRDAAILALTPEQAGERLRKLEALPRLLTDALDWLSAHSAEISDMGDEEYDLVGGIVCDGRIALAALAPQPDVEGEQDGAPRISIKVNRTVYRVARTRMEPNEIKDMAGIPRDQDLWEKGTFHGDCRCDSGVFLYDGQAFFTAPKYINAGALALTPEQAGERLRKLEAVLEAAEKVAEWAAHMVQVWIASRDDPANPDWIELGLRCEALAALGKEAPCQT